MFPINLIVAIGMTGVIPGPGEINLSVGLIAALAGIAAAEVIVDTGSIPLGILAGLGTGLAVGLMNGTLTLYGKRVRSVRASRCRAMLGVARENGAVL